MLDISKFLNKKSLLNLVILISFFLPFYFIPSWEVKGITIRINTILVVFLIVFWLFLLLFRKISFKKEKIFLPLLFFVFISFASLFKSQEISRSLAVFSFNLFVFLLCFIVFQTIEKKEDLKKIIFALFLSTFLVSLFGFWQFFGDIFDLSNSATLLKAKYSKEILGYPRVHSTFHEPLFFANFLLLPLSFLFLFYLFEIPLFKKPVFYIFLIFFALGNLVLTVSRGGYYAFLILFFLIICFSIGKISFFRKIIPFVLLISIIIAFNFWLMKSFDFSSQEKDQRKFEEHIANPFQGVSYTERKQCLDLGLKAFFDNPLLGIGIGGFGPYAKSYFPFFPKEEYPVVNNQYVEILAETGIFGFLALSWFCFSLLFRTWKKINKFVFVPKMEQTKDKFLKIFLAAALFVLIAFFVQYLSFSTLYVIYIWFLIGLIIACFSIREENHD